MCLTIEVTHAPVEFRAIHACVSDTKKLAFFDENSGNLDIGLHNPLSSELSEVSTEVAEMTEGRWYRRDNVMVNVMNYFRFDQKLSDAKTESADGVLARNCN